jgi:hypothetical protein
MNRKMSMDFVFPKNCLNKGDECDTCGNKSIYELNVKSNHKLYNKDFCIVCKICSWCEEKSTPENICSNCYCPECGIQKCLIIYKNDPKTDFDTIDTNKKNKLIGDHIKNCNGKQNNMAEKIWILNNRLDKNKYLSA